MKEAMGKKFLWFCREFLVYLQILNMLEVILTMADEIQSMESSVSKWKDKMWLITK